MVFEARETNGYDGVMSTRSIGPKTEATDNNNNNDGFLVDSSGGGGEGSSADGVITYTRRKRRKMSTSDEMGMNTFADKMDAVDNGASDRDTVTRLPSGAFVNGLGECSPRRYRTLVLQQMYRSLNGSEGGVRECIRSVLMSCGQSGGTSVIKGPLDCMEGSVNRIWGSTKKHEGVQSGPLLNESENFKNTEFCRRAFCDTLMSEKFSELCGLLLNNFGDVKVDSILDFNRIDSRMKDGAYETLPLLYPGDMEQVWAKLRKVGNEIVALATSLSDESKTRCEQFVRHEDVLPKPSETEACDTFGASNCRGCGAKADVRNSLVCDSCEGMYHVSCTELTPPGIPPKSWYCSNCISNGIGSPHDNCVVCDKIKSASRSLIDKILTKEDESEVLSYRLGSDVDHQVRNGCQSSEICHICRNEVNNKDDYRSCGHSGCPHKYYHRRCLTSKQLGACGSCWYCPSCICRICLVNKDDDQIILCDVCDQAYHIYCLSPPRTSVPRGKWFCGKCDKDLKRIRKARRAYENKQNKAKIKEGVGKVEEKVNEAEVVGDECEGIEKSAGLEMLVTAAKTLSCQEDLDACRNMR